MSLKARLRIAIVALVALVVIAMSALYLYDFTTMTFTGASERADFIAKDVKGNLVDHLQRETAARGLQPVIARRMETCLDRNHPQRSQCHGHAQAHLGRFQPGGGYLRDRRSRPGPGRIRPGIARHASLQPVHDFRDLQGRNWIENLRDLMTRREDYSTTLPVGISSNNQQVVLFNITVLIQSVFLKHDVYPTFKILGLTFASVAFHRNFPRLGIAQPDARPAGAREPQHRPDPRRPVRQSHTSAAAGIQRIRRGSLQAQPVGRTVPRRPAGRAGIAQQRGAVAAKAARKPCCFSTTPAG